MFHGHAPGLLLPGCSAPAVVSVGLWPMVLFPGSPSLLVVSPGLPAGDDLPCCVEGHYLVHREAARLLWEENQAREACDAGTGFRR